MNSLRNDPHTHARAHTHTHTQTSKAADVSWMMSPARAAPTRISL